MRKPDLSRHNDCRPLAVSETEVKEPPPEIGQSTEELIVDIFFKPWLRVRGLEGIKR